MLLIYKDIDFVKVQKDIDTKENDISCEYEEIDDFNNIKIKSK